ncbi:outer membrane protein assembly factor BamE [Rhizobiaceae bacterium]|nr:outer membrane protein assembly factor BamE [Rhizobiaceae bacterium]
MQETVDLRAKMARLARPALIAVSLAGVLAASGCTTRETLNLGYQLNEDSLALVPEGSSRDQVLLSLGTPSTTQKQQDGTETLYYISQKKTKRMAFSQGRIVDQRVLAVYLGEDETVESISNYGLQEGKVFDFTRRVTPTGGKDLSFIGQLLGAAGSVANPFGG